MFSGILFLVQRAMHALLVACFDFKDTQTWHLLNVHLFARFFRCYRLVLVAAPLLSVFLKSQWRTVSTKFPFFLQEVKLSTCFLHFSHFVCAFIDCFSKVAVCRCLCTMHPVFFLFRKEHSSPLSLFRWSYALLSIFLVFIHFYQLGDQ